MAILRLLKAQGHAATVAGRTFAYAGRNGTGAIWKATNGDTIGTSGNIIQSFEAADQSWWCQLISGVDESGMPGGAAYCHRDQTYTGEQLRDRIAARA